MDGNHWAMLAVAARELLLFAASGFLLFGTDDVLVDLIWIIRLVRRRLTVYRRTARSSADMLPVPEAPLALAVFVPAWDESAVIGQMLARCGEAWGHSGYQIFVGCYPNDPLTLTALQPFAKGGVHLVKMPCDGPTSKADCLNHIWDAMQCHELDYGIEFAAIILHDSEDFVHCDELSVFRALTPRLALIQLPVQPAIDVRSRWISGHYVDEFAEAHLKEMIVREAIGASLPSAGTGCCIQRAFLARLAELNGGKPFDATSLTEDYELGLRIGSLGGRSGLVRIRESAGKNLVAVRSHFPTTMRSAVIQKSRWIVGIALAGWDRTGWRGGFAEHWMRWRDRRCLLAALFIASGYLSVMLALLMAWYGHALKIDPALRILLIINGFLVIWRVAIRAICVAAVYGRNESVRSVPRIIVSNMIAVLACSYAIVRYQRMLRDGSFSWGKTSHQFPHSLASAK
jgi:bacteriophage N4 adsorption protein B